MAVLTKFILKYKLTDEETLMINSLTSALDIVDNKTKLKIENMEKGIKDIDREEDKELFNQLLERGYLFESLEDESNTIERLKIVHEELIKRRKTTSFTICPTMGCNLRCTYCFESEDQHNDCTIMTDDQINGIFKYISETLRDNSELPENQKKMLKPPSINLFGGEPLLEQNYNVVNRILEFADKNSIAIKIITNGTTIPYYIELLKKYKEIIQIQITVDGNKDLHNERRIYPSGGGTFEEISTNIDKVLEIGISINLRINIDKQNIESLNKLEEYIKEKKWNENPLFLPYASPVLEFCGCGDEDILSEHEMLDELLNNGYYGTDEGFIKHIVSSSIGFVKLFFDTENTMKPWKIDYCEAITSSNFCFSPDGKITTCLTYCGKGEQTIGTFDKEGVKLDPVKFKLWSERNVFRIEKCRNCKYAFMCGGGCPVAALETNGDIDDVVCSDIANTLDRYVNYLKDRLIKG